MPGNQRKQPKSVPANGVLKNENLTDDDTDMKFGRPVRKSAGKRQSDPNFFDSSKVIDDPLGDFNQANDALSKRPNKAKRKRQPDPEIPELDVCPDDNFEALPPQSALVSESTIVDPIGITLNITPGFSGPLHIELHPSHFFKSVSSTNSTCVEAEPANTRTSMPIMPHRTFPVPPRTKRQRRGNKNERKMIGFFDLPAELRNKIYRLVFVTKEPLNFDHPRNFERSSALLRANKQAAVEGVGILYGENTFLFKRNKTSRRPFWTAEQMEIGYKDMRHFLNMIGPNNRMNLRNIEITFDDAPPGMSPKLSAEDRRYVKDGHLLACLKIIARETQLRKISMRFYGRRYLSRYDMHFIELLCDIQADEVDMRLEETLYPLFPKVDNEVKNLLIGQMTREVPLYSVPGLKK